MFCNTYSRRCVAAQSSHGCGLPSWVLVQHCYLASVSQHDLLLAARNAKQNHGICSPSWKSFWPTFKIIPVAISSNHLFDCALGIGCFFGASAVGVVASGLSNNGFFSVGAEPKSGGNGGAAGGAEAKLSGNGGAAGGADNGFTWCAVGILTGWGLGRDGIGVAVSWLSLSALIGVVGSCVRFFEGATRAIVGIAMSWCGPRALLLPFATILCWFADINGEPSGFCCLCRFPSLTEGFVSRKEICSTTDWRRKVCHLPGISLP